jgi:aspartyl protease family protein
MTNSNILNFIFLVILLAYIIYVFRKSNLSSMRNTLVWLGIFGLLILAYAFRFELTHVKERMISVLIPSYSWSNAKGELVIARSGNGHFYVDAKGEKNQTIHFLIDTGASDVAITKEDALKLGLNPSKLNYTRKYNTANGVSYAAPITIKQITVGKKTFYNIDAHVVSGDLDVSLLGMSLIDNFSNFKITKDMLILEY